MKTRDSGGYMKGAEDITANEEKELVRELDECAFLFGEEFAKLAEPSRSAVAAKCAATADKPLSDEKNTERTRIHIDLGDKKDIKLSPAPSAKEKTVTKEKKNK